VNNIHDQGILGKMQAAKNLQTRSVNKK